jgi:hypothetical protein
MARQEVDAFEIIERTVTPPGERSRRVRSMSVGGLIRELQKCPADAIAMIAFIDPMHNSILGSMQVVIHDYDGSNGVVILGDANIAKKIKVQVEM